MLPVKLQICAGCPISTTAAPVPVESEEETQCHCGADETDVGHRSVNQDLGNENLLCNTIQLNP